jgi:hypothetical protein
VRDLVGGITDKAQIAALAHGLRVAAKLAEEGGASVELRLLQVPTLNFEAFWLHNDNSAKDVFLPISSATMIVGRPTGIVDLTNELRTLAKEHKEVRSKSGGLPHHRKESLRDVSFSEVRDLAQPQ